MAFEQFTIRMDPKLHKKLVQAAARESKSLSAFVVEQLAQLMEARAS